ncbi:MAG TPA: hypothetical protein VHO24_18030 [Opitutaceae bacterium]|nr:hypothetical protein [Opitutaceae bacterium]
MSLTVAFIFLFFACCLCGLLVRMSFSPLGVEDESGFHPVRRNRRQSVEAPELTDMRS